MHTPTQKSPLLDNGMTLEQHMDIIRKESAPCQTLEWQFWNRNIAGLPFSWGDVTKVAVMGGIVYGTTKLLQSLFESPNTQSGLSDALDSLL